MRPQVIGPLQRFEGRKGGHQIGAGSGISQVVAFGVFQAMVLLELVRSVRLSMQQTSSSALLAPPRAR